MPRKDTASPDAASGGKQSPDPPNNTSQSPDPPNNTSQSPDFVCEGRDTSENRESSVDPTLQERRESSAENLEDPKSSASDALSEDSICSRCGGSKSISDKETITLPTQTICTCEPESQQGKPNENPDTEDVNESVASDTLSDDSVCSKCGGRKPGKKTDLKPRKLSCKCRPNKDAVQDTETATSQNTLENRDPSADAPLEEREPSAEHLEDPKSLASDALSEDSMCSRCGGSKSINDKEAMTLPTETICTCDPESEHGKPNGNPDAEDVSESVASDTLSDDSVCSKCGGRKPGKNTDLKPRKFSCKCRPKKDEVQDIENTPTRELPLVAVATKETSQIETFRDQIPDLSRQELPPEEQHDENHSNEDHSSQNRNQLNLESCLPDCPDISCANCNWKINLPIFTVILVVLGLFVWAFVHHMMSKQAGKDSDNNDSFERDLKDEN